MSSSGDIDSRGDESAAHTESRWRSFRRSIARWLDGVRIGFGEYGPLDEWENDDAR